MIGMNGHGYSSSGRSEDANAGILEGVEELQEEECWSTAGVTPREQERTGHE